jgi:hypothetical protein
MWVMWNLISVYLETELAFVQDRCMVCANVPQAQKSFWMHTKELLGDLGHVESCFGLFVDSANLDAREVHGLRRTYQRLKNHFGRTRWNS